MTRDLPAAREGVLAFGRVRASRERDAARLPYCRPEYPRDSKTGQAVLADRQKPDQMTVAERGTKSRQKNCCAIAILRPENRWLACYIAIKEIAEGGNANAQTRSAEGRRRSSCSARRVAHRRRRGGRVLRPIVAPKPLFVRAGQP